jgi:hypothetical protein
MQKNSKNVIPAKAGIQFRLKSHGTRVKPGMAEYADLLGIVTRTGLINTFWLQHWLFGCDFVGFRKKCSA